MQHKYCFEAVSRSLNDLRGTSHDSLFGNIPILLGGDVAQILPVVCRGNRAQTVAACIQQSFIWRHLTVLSLKQNMRVQQGQHTAQFIEWLLQLSYNSNWHRQMKSLVRTYEMLANLDDLIQRFGRCARNPILQGVCILYYEKDCLGDRLSPATVPTGAGRNVV